MSDELLRPTIGADVDVTARPWRLMSQAYVAFFGGVLAVTAIAWLNARRLGVPAAGRRLILGSGAAGFVVVALVLGLLTDDVTIAAGTRVVVRVIAVVTCLVQLRIQRPMDRAFQLRGAEYKSLWWPGLAAVVVGGVIEVLLLMLIEAAL